MYFTSLSRPIVSDEILTFFKHKSVVQKEKSLTFKILKMRYVLLMRFAFVSKTCIFQTEKSKIIILNSNAIRIKKKSIS